MEYLKDHLLSLMRKSAYRPMTMKDLVSRFKVPPEGRAAFRKILAQLCENGDVVLVKGKRYGLAQKMNLVTGRLSAHPDGFGFVSGVVQWIQARLIGSRVSKDEGSGG